MSFQGDVAGLGLGELLQGLGRGGRDGVLNLFSPKISVSLGVHGGQIYLLAGPDETDAEWQRRAANAWADAEDHSRESARRVAIARADRLERLYRLLETSNLHFQFEQGPLPLAPGAAQSHATAASSGVRLDDDRGSRRPQDPIVGWGSGLTAEYLLLEHARISDEAADLAGACLTELDMPRTLDQRQHTPEELDLLRHFDGNSTLLEICDRIGKPLTTIRAKLVPYLRSESVRIADARELLAACQRELELGRTLRAASRLKGWIRKSPAGPPNVSDADLLVGEWERGRLANLLSVLPAREGRALLRKLDHVHTDKRASRQRWSALQECNRTDELILLHEVTMRLVDLADPDASTFQDLLRLARTFQERGLEMRTRMLLTLAAKHLPERPLVRIELGRRMLDVGLVEDGIQWLLEAAAQQLAADEPERALLATRAVLRHDEKNQPAKQLTLRAHQLVRSRRRRKAGTTVILAASVLLAVVALVRFQIGRALDAKLDAITALSDHPEQALEKFDESFPDVIENARLSSLRARLLDRIEAERKADYATWRSEFDRLAIEVATARFEEAVDLILAFEAPPNSYAADDYVERRDLYAILASRLVDEAKRLDVGLDATEEELGREARFLTQLGLLRAKLGQTGVDPEAETFQFGLADLEQQVNDRRAVRARAVDAERRRQREKDLDILLARARAHFSAGELGDAVTAFHRLFEVDPELRKLSTVRDEYDTTIRHHDAVTAARALAAEGRHAEAKATLEVLGRAIDRFPMPWSVESDPSGALVRISDGTSHTTPFEHTSAFGRELKLTFESGGYKPLEVTLSEPRDLFVHLFRHPEFEWRTPSSIEAPPVPVGNDYIVGDRSGGLVRLSTRGEPVWEHRLGTLGGIARTPAFLPRRPGTLLVVTEDGRAWLVDALTGRLEGPSELGAAPSSGPRSLRSGLAYRLENGKLACFESTPQAVFYEPGDEPPASTTSDTELPTLAVLARSATSGLELASPWTEWSARVHPDRIEVTDGDKTLNLENHGHWRFLAWEIPSVSIPAGRLWISDSSGLRAFRPDGAKRAQGR